MPFAFRLRALGFQLFYAFLRVLWILAFYAAARNYVYTGISLPAWLGIPIAVLYYDFAYYWFHRAQHTFPILWRYHKVHHSIEHMGAGSGYHHFSEIALKDLAVFLPLGMLSLEGAGIALAVIGFWGGYVHSNVSLHLGPLSRWIQDNRSHRIHHSVEKRHFDKNFGFPSMVWDRLFGTAHFPAKDEWPQTGLADQREPRTIGAYLAPNHRKAQGRAPLPERL